MQEPYTPQEFSPEMRRAAPARRSSTRSEIIPNVGDEAGAPVQHRRSSGYGGGSSLLPTLQDMTQRLGNMQHGEMRHRHVSFRMQDIGRRLLVAPVPVVLIVSFSIYFGIALVFAALFMLAPAACYDTDQPGERSFSTMLWLSFHTVSTVGFGSPYIYDSCAGPQILVLLESYFSLIVSRNQSKS